MNLTPIFGILKDKSALTVYLDEEMLGLRLSPFFCNGEFYRNGRLRTHYDASFDLSPLIEKPGLWRLEWETWDGPKHCFVASKPAKNSEA